MSDTRLPDYPARLGDKQLIVTDHTGPVSYPTGGETVGTLNNLTGITGQGLGAFDFVDVMDISLSGNYTINTQPSGTGIRKTAKIVWFFSGINGQGVTATQNVAGSGMTVGNVGTITFTGGTSTVTATGTFKVLTATTGTITITNPGVYTVAPTSATVTGTGGTPPTINTPTLVAIGTQVNAGANLSGETVRLRYQGR